MFCDDSLRTLSPFAQVPVGATHQANSVDGAASEQAAHSVREQLKPPVLDRSESLLSPAAAKHLMRCVWVGVGLVCLRVCVCTCKRGILCREACVLLCCDQALKQSVRGM